MKSHSLGLLLLCPYVPYVLGYQTYCLMYVAQQVFSALLVPIFWPVSQSVPAATLPLSECKHHSHISFTLVHTDQPTNRFLVLCGNYSLPSSAARASHLPPTLPNRWQEDRSIIAREGCHVRRPSWRLRACPCQPLCQGSWACQLLHLQSAAAADATHLQVNVFFFFLLVRQSAGERSEPAIQLEQNRFLHCKVRATASGGQKRTCVQKEVKWRFLTVKILLLFSVVVRLWQAYWETVATAVGADPSCDGGNVSCVQK